MQFSIFVALAIASAASAQDTYTSGLAAALNSAGLTTLSTVLGAAPPALLAALQQGNHTVFAPSNAALASADLASANVADILAYHVTAGPIDVSALNANDTVVRTALGTPPAVNLPANQTQVLVVDKAANGTVSVKNAGKVIPVTANATYQNLNVFVIDSILQIPGNLSTVASGAPDLSSLVGAASGIPGVVGALEAIKGITLFAPVNSAFAAVASTIGQVNSTVVTNVLLNHVINGTAVYSTQITNGASFTSAGGQGLSFTTNSSGVFVSTGPTTAKIITANILTSNGVVHLIDAVLLNTNNDPAAAASGQASQSSAQATQTGSQTGAVTPTSNAAVSVGAFEFTYIKLVAGLLVGTALGASLL